MVFGKPEELHVESEQPQHSQLASLTDHVAVHTETFDISDAALGNDLSAKYFRNPRFIGLLVVSLLISLRPTSSSADYTAIGCSGY